MLPIYSAQAIREVPPLSEEISYRPPVAAAFCSLQRENGEKKDFDVEQDEGPPKRKKRKIWVREWLRRRLDADTDTMFTLQRELLAVSLFIVMSSARVCWRVCGSKTCQFQ